MTTQFAIPDASCGHCKATIERVVGELQGVRSAELNLDDKHLRVEHDEVVTSEMVGAAVSDAGYTVRAVS
ncbi:MAG TPA: cation transporter [Actinomycetota bacterium]|nr:cation transporter [Actinomycetota bacterium]